MSIEATEGNILQAGSTCTECSILQPRDAHSRSVFQGPNITAISVLCFMTVECLCDKFYHAIIMCGIQSQIKCKIKPIMNSAQWLVG